MAEGESLAGHTYYFPVELSVHPPARPPTRPTVLMAAVAFAVMHWFRGASNSTCGRLAGWLSIYLSRHLHTPAVIGLQVCYCHWSPDECIQVDSQTNIV